MKWQARWPPARYVASVSVALQIVAAGVLLLVTGAALYELHTSRNAILADTEQQIARLDMTFAEQTGRAVEAVDLLVLGATETIQAGQPLAESMDETLRRRIRGVRQLGAMLILDAAGTITVSTNIDQLPLPAEIIQLLIHRYGVDPHAGLMFSQPFRGRHGKWNTLLVRPLTDAKNALIGLVAGCINLDYFEDFYRAVDLSENGSITLHLRDGTALARFPHIDRVIGHYYGDRAPFTEILAHDQAGTMELTSPIDGINRVLVIRALRAYPLAVVVAVDKNQVLTNWWRSARTLVGGALLLGGTVVLLLLILSRRSAQIERLLHETRAARTMAEQAKDRLLQQISEREKAEGALRQAQRIEAIGQLTGGVAHDFNNLLTVVLGNVDILLHRTNTDGNGALRERLISIRAAAERGATLTGHLLAFARRQPLMPKPVDLNATIHGMRNILDSALGMRVCAHFSPAEDLWPAMVDPSRIELVVLNLVINARDAMPDGGIVTIETTNQRRIEPAAQDSPPPGDYVSITVRDTGTGIPPDILARVFEPFFTTKPPGTGSGLGLSQVFGTARQSGGEVHIWSKVGQGTAVAVDLPRAIALPAAQVEPPQSVVREQNLAVLLVDDDDAVRAVTAALLQERGYKVRDAANGEAAITILRQDAEIGILLTDLVMPGMNGSQLAAVARALRRHLPVLFISGYADQAAAALDPEEHILSKPFSPDELDRAIASARTKARVVLSGV